MKGCTLTVVHLGASRSSVAADLVASTPKPLFATASEQNWPDVNTICAVVERSASAPLSVEWYDGGPPRGHYDLWEAGFNFVIEDLLLPEWKIERGYDGEDYLGIICVRPVEAELQAVRRMVASPNPQRWFILPLGAEGPAVMAGTLVDLAPIIPVPFGDRPHRKGKRLDVDPRVSVYVKARLEVTDEAAADGAALWQWLSLHFPRDTPTDSNSPAGKLE